MAISVDGQIAAQSPAPLKNLLLAPVQVRPKIDGDLADWPATAPAIRLNEKVQVANGAESWAGPQDAALVLQFAFDANSLYLAGTVQDDVFLPGNFNLPLKADAVELAFGVPEKVAIGQGGLPIIAKEPKAGRADDLRLLLVPCSAARPCIQLDPKTGAVSQLGASLTGFEMATRKLESGGYAFEIALPFHQVPGMRPGSASMELSVTLFDRDDESGTSSKLTLNGKDVDAAEAQLKLTFQGQGPLSGRVPSDRLLPRDLLTDISYLIVPLVAVAGLLLMLRGWKRWQARMRWLRPTLLGAGALLFLAGLVLPFLWLNLREDAQQRELDRMLTSSSSLVDKLAAGTLASYRGASRDRALMDLLGGKSVARQKYTSYRFLAQHGAAEFGAPAHDYPEESFGVRPYWVSIESGRPEVFHFDPPLRGEELYFVIGRPRTPFSPRIVRPQLQLELGFENGTTQKELVIFDGQFLPAEPLGRNLHEVSWKRLSLRGELRTLSVADTRGSELFLVGLSLQVRRGEPEEPLFLGSASRDGVITDLRNQYPLDAGLDLGPGETRKVLVPTALKEPGQKLWFFYKAMYPGIPTAIPGATVAEIVINFDGGLPPRTLRLEHQVSLFYEMAVHNTRDQPPDGSPAAIAFSWIDDQQERHLNTVLPVTDLTATASIESIEFRNLAEYQIRFRSVVFGTEKAAAPQDPDDSPLERSGQERQLRADVIAEMAKAALGVYRDGRLQESTLPLDRREDLMTLPRRATEHGTAADALVVELPSGARRLEAFLPLNGEGWDGAMLSVSMTDPDWDRTRKTASQLGLLLVFLGSPLLLLLLSELLAAIANLRLRLMAVLSVASLAPLLALSLVLANVLERGHDADQQSGMRQAVENAVRQLGEEKTQLQQSAQQWLIDLKLQHESRIVSVSVVDQREQATKNFAVLKGLMQGQLPPEWRGAGCLKLEWSSMPTKGAASPARENAIFVGDEQLAASEVPARLEPGCYVQNGNVVIAVRSEALVLGGTLALTVTRPIDAGLLGALAPGYSVLLCDTRGYPLTAGGARFDADLLLVHARNPAVMVQRERDLAALLDQHVPAMGRTPSSVGDLITGVEVLRDLQATPRALLELVQPDQRAMLDLQIGRIPVRAFFFLVAGLLLVLSMFLAFVVSNRISRPVELLEHSSQSLLRGEFGARVPEREGGQLGRLSKTFNQMAADLEGRLLDLQKLNRALRDLSSQLDAGHTLAVLRRFCEQHCAVDRVRIVVLDSEAKKIEVHGGATVEPCDPPPELQFLPRAQGSFCLFWPARSEAVVTGVRSWAPSVRSVVGLPLLAGGRCCGAVLLLFETQSPPEIDLEMLATVVSQAAVALEHAQLYRHAVQDPVTGTFVGEYFRRRAAEEVAVAQQRGVALALLGVGLGDGSMRPRGLRRFAAVLREHAPRNAVLGHFGAGQFQMVALGMDRSSAEAWIGTMLEAWQEVIRNAPESELDHQTPTLALAMFPEEAASAEFLFEALRERLASGSAMAPAAFEMDVDASLQRSGITVVSSAMREVYRTLRRVAPTELAILILGETGAGKEVLTNLTHRWSGRAAGPLVKVHCAALSEALLASELFGHEKGAFTGAEKRKIGKFEQANGGTIFLDEVGEISLDVQVKLLRVLQEREVDRVGGLDPVPVDVRVVAATNRDICAMVAAGKFREDLYYRLQGMVVHVPPLRDRRQEIPALVEQFRNEVVASGQSRVRGFTTDAMDELYRRDWPGNIRELRNTVHRAMVLSLGELVDRRDLQAALPGGLAAVAAPVGPVHVVAGEAKSSPEDTVLSVAPAAGPEVSPVAALKSLPPVPLTAFSEDLALPALSPDHALSAKTATLAESKLQDAARVAPVPAASREAALAALPMRSQRLYQRIFTAGSIGTKDHMDAAGISHRTGLRDLQLLVEAGLVERLGSRRGARYQPSSNWPVAK